MSLKGRVWAPFGPSPIAESSTKDNGLVSAIAINPDNPADMYIGTAGGGAWHSLDGGVTWTSIFDRQLCLGIGEPGALAIDPNNTSTIYLGTSARIDDGTQPPAGIFKSTDGGATWISLGSGFPAGNVGNATQFVPQWINVILVDPADSNTVYLASNSGVFVSDDGGLNWTQGTNAIGDARSLVLDPSSPANARILYAGVRGAGAYRSNDGGATWTQILNGSTPAVASAIGPSPNGFSKVIIAAAPPTSPPNPHGIQVLYVSLSGTGSAPDPVGFFVSTDQGATWKQQAAAGMPKNTQGGYSFHFAVDPASPGDGVHDIIYFGVVHQAKSTNSGVSFSAFTGPIPHADTHAWAFIPQPAPNPSIVFCGSDGGLATSINGGATWSPLNSGGLQTGLFYNISVKPDATGSVTVGALQDNEVETTKGGSGLGWVATSGGDGWDVRYDGQIAGQVYSTSGFWSGTPPVPCTEMYLSTDDGSTFPTYITPWGTSTDTGCYLAPIGTDPSNGGFVYASGSQNLWQSKDSGSTWRILKDFGTTGTIDVARLNGGNNVVIAVGGDVWVSTNALAPTVGPPHGVTFKNITRNLPGRTVARAKFDPNDPTVIYAVVQGFSGAPNGHVYVTTIGGTSWTDISPAIDVPFNAIALDGTDTPTTLYVGCDFGVLRSVDGGATWYVLDDLHLPLAPVLDLALNESAGSLTAATYGRGVFKFVPPSGPVIAVSLQDDLDFGTVCTGPEFLTLKIYNVGTSTLTIDSVQRLMGSSGFFVLPTPSTPVDIAPGNELDFTVAFVPTTPGTPEVAIIRIISNDPAAPTVDLAAIGIGGVGTAAVSIANSGDFGNVCSGSLADELLTINNPGPCPLTIYDVAGSGVFLAPNVQSYPLVVASGASIDLVVRFAPSSYGWQSGTITVISSDPSSPNVLWVSGTAPAPKANAIIANNGSFGNACVGGFVDEPLILTNSGLCTLTIIAITSSSGEFLVPEVVSYPITLAPGVSLPVPIRFQPISFGSKSATITVVSDDPASPLSVNVSGVAPSGTLAIGGSTTFGGVTATCCADRTLSICNVGQCGLDITSVAFKRKTRYWQLLHNPFPATLAPGSCLPVVIRYHALEKCCRIRELVIESNDPVTPVKVVEVEAYTIWPWSREDCDECRKGCCDKPHEAPCRQGYPCGCVDFDDDDCNE
jgi:photosystem II stability/assembly factor-like uncharacterized protein